MQATPQKLDVKGLQKSWSAIDSLVHLRVIHTDEQYDKTISLMNSLVDEVNDDESHPLASLLEIVGDIVSAYEKRYINIGQTESKEVLRYLLDMKNLNQSDLFSVIPQSNLSAILSGKRQISKTVAGKLAIYFNVNPALFLSF